MEVGVQKGSAVTKFLAAGDSIIVVKHTHLFDEHLEPQGSQEDLGSFGGGHVGPVIAIRGLVLEHALDAKLGHDAKEQVLISGKVKVHLGGLRHEFDGRLDNRVGWTEKSLSSSALPGGHAHVRQSQVPVGMPIAIAVPAAAAGFSHGCHDWRDLVVEQRIALSRSPSSASLSPLAAFTGSPLSDATSLDASTPTSSAAENAFGCRPEFVERHKTNELAGSDTLNAGESSYSEGDPTVDHANFGNASSPSPAARA